MTTTTTNSDAIDCPFCDAPRRDGASPHAGRECRRPVGPGGFACTRPRGHAGPHVACGLDPAMHPIAVGHDDGRWQRVSLVDRDAHAGGGGGTAHRRS